MYSGSVLLRTSTLQLAGEHTLEFDRPRGSPYTVAVRNRPTKNRPKKGGVTITRTIRARVRGGMLAPVEPLDLPEGSEVEVSVATKPSEADVAAFRAAAGAWKGTVDAEALIRDIYDDRLIQTRPVPRL